MLDKRAVAVGVVGVIIGASLLTPAGAHVGGTPGHLWKKHLAPLAKKIFYTKKQTLSKKQSDKRYLRRPTSPQEYWVAGSTWVDENGGSTLQYGTSSWCMDNGASGYLIQQVHLPQGATITGYRAGYRDDAASGGSNGSAYLTKEALNGRGGGYDDIDFVDLPNASGWTFADKTLTTPEVVDNKKYAYIFIYILGGDAGACTAGVFYNPPASPTAGQPSTTSVDSDGQDLSNPQG